MLTIRIEYAYNKRKEYLMKRRELIKLLEKMGGIQKEMVEIMNYIQMEKVLNRFQDTRRFEKD